MKHLRRLHSAPIRIALLFCGTCMLIFGISRGEAATVLQKAIYICMECIGIG